MRVIITIEIDRENKEEPVVGYHRVDGDLAYDSFNSDDMVQVAVEVEAESVRLAARAGLKTGRRLRGMSDAMPTRHSMQTRNSKSIILMVQGNSVTVIDEPSRVLEVGSALQFDFGSSFQA
ncbi:hypothetical protein QYF36_020264 [Acer negundo]|nr:hypothetical protein QYF36_020264 [Acer negundo]